MPFNHIVIRRLYLLSQDVHDVKTGIQRSHWRSRHKSHTDHYLSGSNHHITACAKSKPDDLHCDLLAIQDLKSSLQRLDLGLTRSHLVFVAWSTADTSWLQFVIVGHGGIELFLCALQINFLLLQGLLLGLLGLRSM